MTDETKDQPLAPDDPGGPNQKPEGGDKIVPTESSTTEEAKAPVTEDIEFPEINLEEVDERGYSQEQFDRMMSIYGSTLQEIKEGEIVTGRVLDITDKDVIVDVGFKSEGVIPIEEFPDNFDIKPGEEINVYLESIEDQDGQLVLSKQKADFMKVWDQIKEAYDNDQTVPGRPVRKIKGGLVVDLRGVDAFLPGSQIALRQIPDFDSILGEEMEFKIIKLNRNRRNIVVSRRVVLESEREEQRSKLISEIETGQVRKGVVKNVTDFGVFIDLGGVDGLLHITDMSWGRVGHPSEMVKIGQEIDVKILDFDKNTGRISLGLKQLTPYPWDTVEERYPVGSRVKGRVVSITDYGAFVELEKGVEGLIHISEMSWTQHIKHPSKLLSVNDEVEVVVLSVDAPNEKISLGIKQLEPDPWLTFDLRYPVGTRLTGKVRNLTTFGAFVEIEEGIDGLVHISDMSWTKRVQHPSEVMKKGDLIDVVILSIDKENRRISLGHKQFTEDPWPALAEKYPVGAETTGKIIKLLDRGIIVELEPEIEGFVPTNQLGKPDIAKPVEAFSEGETLPLRVIEFDANNRKIVLSVDAYYRDREKAELDAYLAEHPTKSVKIGDVVGEQVTEKLQAEAEREVPAEPGPESGEPASAEADTEKEETEPEKPAPDPADGEEKPA